MFLTSSDINLRIISVLSIDKENNSGNSGDRNFHALSYRIKSNAEFTHNDVATSAHTGDIIFTPAHCEYSLVTEEEKLIVIHFLTNEDLPDGIKKFTPENKDYFNRKFTELYTTWTKKNYGYMLECKSILFKILLKIEQEYQSVKTYDDNSVLLEAVEYIHDNYTKRELTVEALSKMCNMSDTYFRRIFVKHCGVTPLRYIQKLKLEYALELLNSGYYTVGKIADKCGFITSQHFSMFIKKETGSYPSKFLNKNK